MTKYTFFGVAIVVCIFAVATARQAQPPVDRIDEANARTQALSIPVGGVILWWGLESEIPPGFEVCDGRAVTTPDATLRTTKPDLRGRFPRGIEKAHQFRPWQPNTGGADKDEVSTEPQVIDELPAHTHAVSTAPQHTHPLTDHMHVVGDHVHVVQDHAHQLPGEFETHTFLTVGAGNDNAETVTIFVSGESEVNSSDDGGGQTGEPVDGDIKQPVTGGVSPAKVLVGPDTSTVKTPSPPQTGSTGEKSPEHAHDIKTEDIMPAFTDFIFIIRVK